MVGPGGYMGRPDGSHVRGPYGPIVHHWRILIGPMWAALCATLVGTMCGPYGLPVWAQMGPWWGSDGSHVPGLYGPLVAPGQFCLGPTALSIPYLYRMCNVGIISCMRI